jgi:hypothetical protein
LPYNQKFQGAELDLRRSHGEFSYKQEEMLHNQSEIKDLQMNYDADGRASFGLNNSSREPNHEGSQLPTVVERFNSEALDIIQEERESMIMATSI